MSDPEFQNNIISNVILYDKDGVSMAVSEAIALPVGTRGFVGVAIDGGGLARFVASDTVGRQIAVGAAADGTSLAGNPVLIAGSDGTNVRTLQVDNNKNLRVAATRPIPPVGSTAVVIAQAEANLSISGSSPVNTEYIIPTAQTFYLQTLSGGAAGDPSESGSRIDVIYYDGATEHVVTRLYVSGQTTTVVFPDSSQARDGTAMTGNGSTKKIILRRIRLSQASQEVDGEVRGYVV